MATVTVGQENTTDIEIYNEDHGAGQPVVLTHGYPQSGRAALIEDVQLVVVDGGPHAIPWTHAVQVNPARLDVIRSLRPDPARTTT